MSTSARRCARSLRTTRSWRRSCPCRCASRISAAPPWRGPVPQPAVGTATRTVRPPPSTRSRTGTCSSAVQLQHGAVRCSAMFPELLECVPPPLGPFSAVPQRKAARTSQWQHLRSNPITDFRYRAAQAPEVLTGPVAYVCGSCTARVAQALTRSVSSPDAVVSAILNLQQ